MPLVRSAAESNAENDVASPGGPDAGEIVSGVRMLQELGRVGFDKT